MTVPIQRVPIRRYLYLGTERSEFEFIFENVGYLYSSTWCTPVSKCGQASVSRRRSCSYYYYIRQYHIVRSKLHKTVYNFLKSNREPKQDIPELLLVRDPPRSRSTDYRPTGVPNRLQELYINRKIQFTRTANCVRAARDLNL